LGCLHPGQPIPVAHQRLFAPDLHPSDSSVPLVHRSTARYPKPPSAWFTANGEQVDLLDVLASTRVAAVTKRTIP
jgi:hypothetical protein